MRGLDYFLFADNPSDVQHALRLESELTRPRYRPFSDTFCSSRLLDRRDNGVNTMVTA